MRRVTGNAGGSATEVDGGGAEGLVVQNPEGWRYAKMTYLPSVSVPLDVSKPSPLFLGDPGPPVLSCVHLCPNEQVFVRKRSHHF